MKYTGRDKGNRLEREVYRKLLDDDEISQLKADSLFFFHVYADLVMLAKSSELNKSTFDMNKHYLELQAFLQEVENCPEVVTDRNYQVFTSEEMLYGDNKKINHRVRPKSQPVYENLFIFNESDENLLYPLVSAGASAMSLKLSNYAQNQLPGGIYWDPEPGIKNILKKLKPSNDFCESILGLNDYLSTALPNMHQMTKSNIVQVKKNKTIKWLHDLPVEQREKVVDLAVEKRVDVLKERKKMDHERSEHRRENMLQTHMKKQALEQRKLKETDKLSELHLITSPEELQQALLAIEKENISASKKKAEKIDLLRKQVAIHTKKGTETRY